MCPVYADRHRSIRGIAIHHGRASDSAKINEIHVAYNELNLHYNIVGLVVSRRFQIPLHGPTDFVCDPTRPTDKIRTCRD